jgi:hypothetical protein
MVEARTAAAQRRRIAYALLPELPAADPQDPAAATNDHAAIPDPTPHPEPLGVGLHLAATITPPPAGEQAPGGATTPPVTNIAASSERPHTPPTTQDAP